MSKETKGHFSTGLTLAIFVPELGTPKKTEVLRLCCPHVGHRKGRRKAATFDFFRVLSTGDPEKARVMKPSRPNLGVF